MLGNAYYYGKPIVVYMYSSNKEKIKVTNSVLTIKEKLILGNNLFKSLTANYVLLVILY
jgi:hypothetical protein